MNFPLSFVLCAMLKGGTIFKQHFVDSLPPFSDLQTLVKESKISAICDFNETVTHFPQFDKPHGAEFSKPQQSDMASHSITESEDKIYICSECQRVVIWSIRRSKEAHGNPQQRNNICLCSMPEVIWCSWKSEKAHDY